MPRYDSGMSDARMDPSEHASTAARARWFPSPLVARSAAIVTERADELDAGQAAGVLAAFGAAGWLPLSVRRAWADEERAEAEQARQAKRDLEERCEARRAADLTFVTQQAEARGEVVSPLAMATGHVAGRNASQVLADALAASDREDARAEFEANRKRGEKLELVGELEPPSARRQLLPPDEPGDPSARSAKMATKRALERRQEAFEASLDATRKAEQARDALERRMPQLHRPWRRGR
jgi:hypothetical protein